MVCYIINMRLCWDGSGIWDFRVSMCTLTMTILWYCGPFRLLGSNVGEVLGGYGMGGSKYIDRLFTSLSNANCIEHTPAENSALVQRLPVVKTSTWTISPRSCWFHQLNVLTLPSSHLIESCLPTAQSLSSLLSVPASSPPKPEAVHCCLEKKPENIECIFYYSFDCAQYFHQNDSFWLF